MIAAPQPTHAAAVTAPNAADRLAVALDFPTAAQAIAFVDSLEGSCRWMKVGLELYCAAGNSLIETLRNRGMNVFLDLKLHDIPNTVAGAIRTVTSAGASLLTVHAAGGEAMLRAAAEAAAENVNSPRLLAVTVLTSMDTSQLTGIGIHDTPATQVLRLAHLATACGVDGLVCSAEEVAPIRQTLGAIPYLVVPGIRPTGSPTGDQRRIATPAEAIQSGASMLVVGRPITQSQNPAETARVILAEIASV
ncbi:orotidine-5'-phosphate decarboxylase [Granulicella sibirica]|uniref:Orotidine 5'-phosphate decarboxylase n=1 Tax=Granulicella sibirica TaxID=2479048 RepID=A0A4Q0SZJ0_9BACT|nr:orotidine-5'-phosphate decarboxylase [Granulicella sibirica]RXH55842.1 Orotidine 5'-phosphate decarboxylase [Granulicella sibirica]